MFSNIEREMFSNIERKLKALARINLICSIIVAVACPFVGGVIDVVLIVFGVIAGVILLLVALIQGWFIYAYAELLENIKEVNRTLKVGYSGELLEAAEQQQKEEEKRRKLEAEENQRAEEQRKAYAKAKQARIADYWEKHAEEKQALLEKRMAAESKLKEVSGLAGKQRDALQELIRAIDEELNKDREG